FICVSVAFILFGLLLAIFNFDCSRREDRPDIEITIRSIQTFYILFVLLPTSLAYAIWHLRTKLLPVILKKQLKILIAVFMIPIWIFDVLQGLPYAIL